MRIDEDVEPNPRLRGLGAEKVGGGKENVLWL